MNTTDNSIRVLLIEDNPGDVRLIGEMLQEAKGRKIVLEHCATLTQGLQALSKNDFNILLLDLTLPDSIGFDTFVKVYTQNPQIPIVVLTGTNDEELARKSVRTGAQDYLIKGQIDSSLLSRSISYAIERAGLLRVVQQELIERKAMESMLRKVNRALHMLSECNGIIVHNDEEKILAEKICHAIVTIGEYQFAWIAFTESDNGKSIHPIAIADSKDGNSPVEASAWFKRDPDSPLSEALKTGKVFVCDDVTVDKRCSNLRAEADKLGYRSFVMLPLVTGGKTLGVVQICSKELDRFDQEELKLLHELKEDIAYAIVSIRTEKERKRSEEEIKMLARFPSENPSPILRIDRDGTILNANEASSALLQNWDCSLGDCVPTFWRDVISEVLTCLERKTIEIKLGERTFSFFVVPISEAGYVNLYGLDITERKRAEEALRSEQMMLARTEGVAHVGSWEWDIATDTVTWSDELFRIFQRDPREGAPSFAEHPAFYHPDDMARLLQVVEVAVADGTPYELELRAIRKDGVIRSCVARGLAERGLGGRAVRLFGSLQDITERKRAEEAFEAQTLYFRQLFESSPAGTVMLDSQFSILNANQAFITLFQYSLDEIKGKNIHAFIVPENKIEEAKDLSHQIVKNESVDIFETKRKRKDGMMIEVLVSGHTIIIKNQIVGFYFMYVDISRQKRLQEQLIQAQKMESLGTLAGGMAHDFNNILAIILGHASLIERVHHDPVRLKGSLDNITKAGERGASLVRQMLTFARKGDVEFKPVLINDFIKEIDKLFRETFPKTMTLSCSLSENLPMINADSTQIHQVLLNLCVNARDAMNGVGTLTVTTGLESGETLRTHFPDAVAEKYISVELRDTGTGMSETTLRHIFEPFFTTKSPGKGTGLGLAVVFGIMEIHEGFIGVQSKPECGTSFFLYFPVKPLISVVHSREKELPREVHGGTETILVIEDEELLRELIHINLLQKGYKVLTALDGKEGIEKYKLNRDTIGLVLSDLGMPKLTGHEVLKRLKKISPSLKFILTSGFNDPIEKSEILKDGADTIIQKPYDMNDLLRTIRAVLDGENIQ